VNSALKFCDEIVSRSLQADPNLRYQNVKEFIAMINLISES